MELHGVAPTTPLVTAAALLQAAYDAVTLDLETRSPSMEIESFALFILLAQGHAVQLLPDDKTHVLPDVDHAGVLQLLEEAERLIMGLPVHHLVGGTTLLVELGSLVRDARQLGL